MTIDPAVQAMAENTVKRLLSESTDAEDFASRATAVLNQLSAAQARVDQFTA